jgi:signal transduction histidine kinase
MVTTPFVFELLDDFLYIALGALIYSYTREWFGARRAGNVPVREWVNGLAFGGLAIALIVQGIPAGPGILIDARHVPIALIALFDGWAAGAVAGLVAASFRAWLGGPGTLLGSAAILATAIAGGLTHEWARRTGSVRPRHTAALSAVVFVIVAARLLVLGGPGFEVFARVWPSYLTLILVGIGLLARLFHDVVERERVAELRAVTLLANAAAHEINNPLAVVMGSLDLLATEVPADRPGIRLVDRAREGAERIKEIVTRMQRITRLERLPGDPGLPALLDIRRSSEPG